MEQLLMICVVLLVLMVLLLMALVAMAVAKELRRREWKAPTEWVEERQIQKDKRKTDREQQKEAIRQQKLLMEVESYDGNAKP